MFLKGSVKLLETKKSLIFVVISVIVSNTLFCSIDNTNLRSLLYNGVFSRELGRKFSLSG